LFDSLFTVLLNTVLLLHVSVASSPENHHWSFCLLAEREANV